jgi:two-component system, OmpR family, response regulator
MACEALVAVCDRRPALDPPGQRISDHHDRSIRVLLVDGDPTVRHQIVGYLEDHNITVTQASGLQQVARLLATGQFDLVILDLPLGSDNGFVLLREIRSRAGLPVIITGCHREEIDRVVALDFGADDYLSKPFSLRELLARVRAVRRRRTTASVRAIPKSGRDHCRFVGWHFNRRARRLIDPNGALVTLTNGEYALLIAFLAAPQRPLTREQLLKATRVHEDVFDRTVDVQITRLRRKLAVDRTSPPIIQTERGTGYLFVPEVEQF